MTYFILTIKEFLFGHTREISQDPVYRFFFETSSAKRKKVYNKALQKAQLQQEHIARSATEKNRA